MTIFTILMPIPQPKLVDAIKTQFPNDHFSITETQWLVSSFETIVNVTAKLGIYDEKSPSAPSNGNAIIFAISSYHGRAPVLVWDWIKSKLEASVNG